MAKRGSHAVVVLPDLHIPEQDPAALSVAMAAIRRIKPARVVILGDWLECSAFSRHPKGTVSDPGDFETDEIDPCNKVLDEIQKHTRKLIYIEGNHEAFVMRSAGRGDDAHRAALSAIDPKIRLSRGRKDFTWISFAGGGHAHYEITPDLWAIHGWSLSMHAAKKNLEMLKDKSVVYGHTHRKDFYSTRIPGSNRIIESWSDGCLRTLQPDWLSVPSQWSHGFSVVYCKDDLTKHTAYSVRIDRGECVLPDGKTIRG